MSESPPRILERAAETFRERNQLYGCTWQQFGQTWANIAFVDSTASEENIDFMTKLILNKLLRFLATGMKHVDSIHDIIVYAAMIESLLLDVPDAIGAESA